MAYSGVVIGLSALALGLIVTLLVIRRSQRRAAATARATFDEMAEFLRLNNIDGSVRIVARKVTDILEETFNCERVVFLKCREGILTPSYSHGVTHQPDYPDFQLVCCDEMASKLCDTVKMRAIDELQEIIPAEAYCRITGWGCDYWLPIFWREKAYGLYVLKSTPQLRTPEALMCVTSLGQSLAVAYGMAAHEEEVQNLAQQIEESHEATQSLRVQGQRPVLGVLKLVRHRNSETLVGKIVDEVQRDLGLERFAFFYESKQRNRPLGVHRGGVGIGLTPPPRDVFRELLADMGDSGLRSVEDLSNASGPVAELGQAMRGAGLKFLVTMPLSSTRSALLAWDDCRGPDEVLTRLRMHGMSFVELMENAESFERVEELSYTDNLTGLANRRYFVKRLQEEIGRAERYRRSLGLIILDLDQLKGINDYYGHQAGDAVIRRMGEILKSSIRSIDVTARYGGDEFCVIMPESDAVTCARFMERLQQKIAGSAFSVSQVAAEFECTISQGGAVFPDHGRDTEQLIFAADMALLRAKESGRNKYMLY